MAVSLTSPSGRFRRKSRRQGPDSLMAVSLTSLSPHTEDITGRAQVWRPWGIRVSITSGPDAPGP
nr:MAG TPA: hypothetical protein [Caudoviricetes sp.]